VLKQLCLVGILGACSKAGSPVELSDRVVTAILAGDTKACEALYHVPKLTDHEAKSDAAGIAAQAESRRTSCEACVAMVRGAKRIDNSKSSCTESKTSYNRLSECSDSLLGESRVDVRVTANALTDGSYAMTALSCYAEKR
jgi:hypothetical protein